MSVLAVTGLTREAHIIAGAGVVTVTSGGAIDRLAAQIEAALTPDITGIISIGIAGALDPALEVTDTVIATAVRDGEQTYRTDPAWTERLAATLLEARRGIIAGSDLMLVDAAAKRALHASSGALCVDMESHVAARAAKAHGLPFAALRIISDDARRALPKAAQAGMKPDGGMDLGAVLNALAADPRQLPALICTGVEAEAAFRALLRSRRRLGPALLGFGDV